MGWLQHTRLLCPPLSPKVCSNSCSLSQWCYLTISSSVVPFSSCPQSFPASGSFPMSQLLTSGGQSIGASASATVLPVNIQSWFSLPSEPFLSVQCSSVVCECSVMPTSLWPQGFQLTRLLCPWKFPGKNTGVNCNFFLQGIFGTQGLNRHLLHWRADSLPLSHLESLLFLGCCKTDFQIFFFCLAKLKLYAH